MEPVPRLWLNIYFSIILDRFWPRTVWPLTAILKPRWCWRVKLIKLNLKTMKQKITMLSADQLVLNEFWKWNVKMLSRWNTIDVQTDDQIWWPDIKRNVKMLSQFALCNSAVKRFTTTLDCTVVTYLSLHIYSHYICKVCLNMKL